jgi:EAL domain-containing protein (putative c-di-GMP-specific phosphodiesterase class I)
MTGTERTTECNACKDGVKQPFPFSMAFQPIVDTKARQVFAYEALVRGVNCESAYSILSQVTPENRYAFDQNCRVAAITLASKLGLVATGARLSINFMPGAVYSPAACIQLTLKTAKSVGFPLDRLIFEITEDEEVVDRKHLRSIIEEYRRQGFAVAVDDFGAGYCGMNLLADLPMNIIKLDMGLTRNLQERPAAISVVRAMVGLAGALGSRLVAEGVETREEYRTLQDCGVELMQGYLLAKPMFEGLPAFTLPALRSSDHEDEPDPALVDLNSQEPGTEPTTPGGLVLIKKTA